MQISINSYLPTTDVEGPNTRFCIWTQGCSIRCKGCANSHMWDKSKGVFYEVEALVDLILTYKDKIEGITFLGGEPLDQIEAVTYIAKRMQEENLTVLVFTGYDYEDLLQRSDFCELSRYVDLLIDGRYDSSKRDFSRPWVGSLNQKYRFLSEKYDESILKKYKNKIEVRINDKNEIELNGMGDYQKLMKLIRKAS